jgi:2-dehydro-3-deoxygalactonokinase
MDTRRAGVLVGVDWGTTHRRAYALDSSGACSESFADGEGALACKGRFAPALDAALAQLRTAPDLVVLSGMVGSALGWQEVPYVNGNVPLTELQNFMAPVANGAGTAHTFIVPGYCVRNAVGQPDVMRGEETQLLGAVAQGHADGWFVLPGTHSKWVLLEAGRVVQLRTYMTGELFNLLGSHGTLASAASTATPVWSDTAFAEGVQGSGSGSGALSHLLFGARARVVSGDMPAASTQSYLSGLLIGTELRDVMRTPDQMQMQKQKQGAFKLIGSPELARHYQSAAALLDLTFDILDAQSAYLAALHHIQTHWEKP